VNIHINSSNHFDSIVRFKIFKHKASTSVYYNDFWQSSLLNHQLEPLWLRAIPAPNINGQIYLLTHLIRTKTHNKTIIPRLELRSSVQQSWWDVHRRMSYGSRLSPPVCSQTLTIDLTLFCVKQNTAESMFKPAMMMLSRQSPHTLGLQWQVLTNKRWSSSFLLLLPPTVWNNLPVCLSQLLAVQLVSSHSSKLTCS